MKNIKVLIIGLDGVPLSLIQNWADAGKLPNLRRLMMEGVSGHLRSTVPPTSGPSWSSFQTGKNPGQTNIYDFLYRRKGTYIFAPVNTAQRDGQTIWSLVNQAGYTAGVLNMPMTYPVEQVDGFMISGFLTPYTAPDFIHPPELLAELEREVGHYRIYPTDTFSEGRLESFLDASYRLLEMRTRAALYLMDKHPTDLMAMVYFDTDRILHQLWHFLDPHHPWRQDEEDRSDVVAAYFQRLDESIGRLLEKVDDDTLVIILSDHGMGSAYNFVVLNNWLLDVGLLQLKRNPLTRLRKLLFDGGFTLRNVHKVINRLGLAKHAEYKAGYFADHLIKMVFLSFLDVDWSKSLAYSFGRHLGAIYVNLKGREPQGIVEPGQEYEQVREQIIDLTPKFVDPASGRPLIGRVARREELYTGPHLDKAPDLTLFPAEETDIFFGLSDFGSNNIIGTVYRYSGMHRDHGLLIMHGKDMESGARIEGAVISDIAPTILYAMGIEVPRDMDGQVLKAAFRNYDPGRLVFAEPSDNGRSAGRKQDVDTSYTKEDEREIVERLRKLGYLG
jgi:predicted AlkP superfamily phosphohydrolase/phosphomutase